MGRAGDGSTLNLDFTAMGGTLDSRITFSRADATALATFVNSSGIVTTVATAQAPRFDFDPTTLVPKGLLIESPATNVATNSNALGNAGGLTRTYPAGVLSPDGTANSQRFTKTDVTTPRYIYPTTSFTVAASTKYVASVWLKYDGFAFTTQIQSDTASDWNGGWTAAFVIASTGITVGSRTGICSASTVTAYPNGWYRCTATITTGATPLGVNPRFLIDVVGTTGTTVLVYGMQLEANALESSYIATGASAVTRAADTALMTGTNFSSWYTGNLTGTFVTEWFYGATATTASTVIATCDVARQHLHQYVAATTARLRLANKVPVVIETTNATGNISINEGAFSYQASVAQSLCLNGGTVATGTFVHSENPTWFSIGGVSSDGTSITDTTTMLNNSIRKIKYFPTRLSNGQLQDLTNPNIATTADVLAVAGGGGGGGTIFNQYGAGGGGAGGLVYTTGVTLARLTTYTVAIGAGGAGATGSAAGSSGANSTLKLASTSITTDAVGGGGGGRGSGASLPGTNGGSGGGAGGATGQAGGTGTSGQGFAGGSPGADGVPYRGAGGGGASAVGANGNAGTGNGGAGSTYFGTAYAGGGGGGAGSTTPGSGGTGGGGAGGSPATGLGTAGTANTGGGGGGAGTPTVAGNTTGGAGGSGIIRIRYPGAPVGSVTGATNTTTQSGGFTFHNFLENGTLVMM